MSVEVDPRTEIYALKLECGHEALVSYRTLMAQTAAVYPCWALCDDEKPILRRVVAVSVYEVPEGQAILCMSEVSDEESVNAHRMVKKMNAGVR